jgi:hypothetical protein
VAPRTLKGSDQQCWCFGQWSICSQKVANHVILSKSTYQNSLTLWTSGISFLTSSRLCNFFAGRRIFDIMMTFDKFSVKRGLARTLGALNFACLSRVFRPSCEYEMEHWEPKLEEVWQANLTMKYHMNYRLVLLDNLMITTRHARASALCSSTGDSNYMSLAPRSSRQGNSHSAPHLRNHRLRVASIGDRGLEKALWVYFAIEEIMSFHSKDSPNF